MIDVLCAGIICADHVCAPVAHLPAAGELVMTDSMLLTVGGCAANAAVDLAKMNVRVAIAARLGSDVFGHVVTDILRDAQVDVSCLKISAGVDTSQTLLINVQGEDRRFIHTFGANRDFRARDIPLPLLDRVKVLYLGGYLVMPGVTQDELAPEFAAARARGVKTVLDIVVPAKGEYLSRFDRLLPHVDVFLPNNYEAEVITGEKDPLKQADVFQRLGAGTTIITMGGQGAVLVQKDLRLRSGVYAVPFVDPSGGGDAFDAGYICGLLDGKGPEDCLRIASALGASCVRAIGTTPGVFTRVECEAFLRDNELKIERI
ncbi:MAG: carbohydrate kinase family protein [Planctomycetes bacterium]|nr:carbohydrate kinase family protein [Planctomycetota bacterium]